MDSYIVYYILQIYLHRESQVELREHIDNLASGKWFDYAFAVFLGRFDLILKLDFYFQKLK